MAIIKLSKFIGKGAIRLCFEHPSDAKKCVKVSCRYKDDYLLERELKAYSISKPILKEYLNCYEETLVQTNLGKGLVSDLLYDDDGSYSKPLSRYISKTVKNEELSQQLSDFAYKLIHNNLYFYDFNIENFLVQIKDGHKKLLYTDLKSFRRYKPYTFLRLETICQPLAKHLMIKRLKRLFYFLDIPFIKY